MFTFEIHSVSANHWWRETVPAGALLNKLMILFIFVPIGLVLYEYYTLSFVVFSFMIPYGFLMRFLAVRAVRHHLEANPEHLEEFQKEGIISMHHGSHI